MVQGRVGSEVGGEVYVCTYRYLSPVLNIYRQLTIFLYINNCTVIIAAVYDVRMYVRVSAVARPRIEGADTCDWTDAGEGIRSHGA